MVSGLYIVYLFLLKWGFKPVASSDWVAVKNHLVNWGHPRKGNPDHSKSQKNTFWGDQNIKTLGPAGKICKNSWRRSLLGIPHISTITSEDLSLWLPTWGASHLVNGWKINRYIYIYGISPLICMYLYIYKSYIYIYII